jgi:hypothetical protein
MKKVLNNIQDLYTKISFAFIFLFLTIAQNSFAAPTIGILGSCSVGQIRSFRDLIMNLVIGCVLSRVIYLIISLAVVVFLYGVFKFIRAEGDDKQNGRDFILYGIIGIFVMVSLWGLVRILQSTFNLNNSDITPRSINIQPF